MSRDSLGLRPSAVVLSCILGLSVSVSAILLVTFPVFFAPLSERFGWSRGQLSLAFSLAGLAIALASPPIGRMVGRFGVRPVLLIAIPSFAAVVAAAPLLVTDYTGLLVWAVLAGAVGAAGNTFVYLSILPSWFSARLGLALGIAMTGIGVGHAAAPIAAQYLIDHYGWEHAYGLLAFASLVIALPAVLFLMRSPATQASRDPARTSEDGKLEAAPAWLDRRLILFGLSFFLIALCASGAAVHAIPILKDKGLGAAEAAKYGAMGGIAVLVTRLVTGYLLDRFNVRYIAAFNCICAAATPLVLLGPVGLPLAVFAPLLAGMSIGAEGDLMPYAIKKSFGLENYALVYSRLFLFYNLGVLAGPLAMGITHDRFGTYDPILLLLSAAMILALILFSLAMRVSAPSVPAPGHA